MLTKGAIGNLVNRYRAVLKKCNLMNTFGSLAMASMLVMGGAGVAEALEADHSADNYSVYFDGNTVTAGSEIKTASYDKNIFIHSGAQGLHFKPGAIMNAPKNDIDITLGGAYISFTEGNAIYGYNLKITQIDQVNNDASDAHGGIIEAKNSIEFTSYLSPEGMDIKAPKITFLGSAASYGDTKISAEEFELHSTVSLYGNTSFNSENSTVTFKDTARIQAMGDNPVKIGTLNVAGTDTRLVDRMPGNDEGATSFDIGTVSISKDSTLSVYAKKKGEGTPATSINFGDVTMAEGSTMNLGFVPEDDFNCTFDKKEIGSLTLDENASVVAKSGIVPEDAPSTLADNGEVAIKEIDFVGNASVQATVTGDSTSINVGKDVSNATISALASKQASINVENPVEGALSINEVAEGSSVEVTTGKENNTGELNTLAKAVNIAKNNGNVTASIAENDIYGAISGTLEEGGKVSDIKQARNTLMDAALKQASVTTLSIDKLLTNDVRKRLGDIRSDKNESGVWMRWDGGKLKGDGLTNDFNTIQIGGDTKVAKNCRIGVAGSFTHGDAEFARGNAELEGFSFATYATWMGENGMFADVVARLGNFNSEMNVEGRKGKLDNRVFSLSGEYGWRFNVCDQFFVEPQAELAYTYVSSDSLELGDAKYLIDSVDSLTGRLGLVAGWNLPNDMGNVYARASVLQQFMGDAKISGSNGTATNVQKLDGNDTWLEYGIGANVKLTDKAYIWADVERTEGADIEEEWRGTVGIRYSF